MSNNKIFKKILIGEIPKSIRQEVSDHIRHYSVVLLISNNDDNKVIPCAGTLCQIGKHYGIITAGHVWKEIKDSKELIIPSGFRGGQISLEPGYLEAYCPFIQVDRNGIETDLPGSQTGILLGKIRWAKSGVMSPHLTLNWSL